eukprot:2770101-Amphidinium_carterae.1
MLVEELWFWAGSHSQLVFHPCQPLGQGGSTIGSLARSKSRSSTTLGSTVSTAHPLPGRCTDVGSTCAETWSTWQLPNLCHPHHTVLAGLHLGGYLGYHGYLEYHPVLFSPASCSNTAAVQ